MIALQVWAFGALVVAIVVAVSLAVRPVWSQMQLNAAIEETMVLEWTATAPTRLRRQYSANEFVDSGNWTAKELREQGWVQ